MDGIVLKGRNNARCRKIPLIFSLVLLSLFFAPIAANERGGGGGKEEGGESRPSRTIYFASEG